MNKVLKIITVQSNIEEKENPIPLKDFSSRTDPSIFT